MVCNVQVVSVVLSLYSGMCSYRSRGRRAHQCTGSEQQSQPEHYRPLATPEARKQILRRGHSRAMADADLRSYLSMYDKDTNAHDKMRNMAVQVLQSL